MGVFNIQTEELFNRTWAVTIATTASTEDSPTADGTDGLAVKVTDLDIKFKIEKSTEDKPNTCELTVYNFTEEQRAAIELLNPVTQQVSKFDKGKVKEAARKQATKGIPIKIEAGFNGNNSLLWLGDLRSVTSERKGTDWETTFKSGDGEKAYQNARLNVSYGPQTPVDTALRAMVRSLKVGEGNMNKIGKDLRLEGKYIPKGTVFSGPTRDMMNDFCRAADLEWSIQDGAIQFIDKGKALSLTAIKLSSATGMLDSPSVDVDGILKVKTLLIPDVRPGRLLVVNSRRIKGDFKIEKITYTGDSSGGDWGLEIEAARY